MGGIQHLFFLLFASSPRLCPAPSALLFASLPVPSVLLFASSPKLCPAPSVLPWPVPQLPAYLCRPRTLQGMPAPCPGEMEKSIAKCSLGSRPSTFTVYVRVLIVRGRTQTVNVEGLEPRLSNMYDTVSIPNMYKGRASMSPTYLHIHRSHIHLLNMYMYMTTLAVHVHVHTYVKEVRMRDFSL